MTVSKEHELIFVHVPKCAGTSINAMFGMTFLELEVGEDIPAHIGVQGHIDYWPELWEKYPSFTVVRNPFSRLVSTFDYAKNTESVSDYEDLQGKSFQHAVRKIDYYRTQAWDKQVEFVYGDNGEAPDRILKFENLPDNLIETCKDFGIEDIPDVLHKNKSNRDRDWKSYYDKEEERIAREYYREDFEQFDYDTSIQEAK
jgi:hypothetical protein